MLLNHTIVVVHHLVVVVHRLLVHHLLVVLLIVSLVVQHLLIVIYFVVVVVVVVRAHRNPATNISSACSLLEGMHGTYYEASCLNRQDLSQDVVDFTQYVVQQTPQDLKSHVDDKSSCHVKFDYLVQDPLQTVKEVYKKFNWEFTAEYERILVDFLKVDQDKRNEKKRMSNKNNKRQQHGMYEHTPDRFGLNDYDFHNDKIFSNYVKKFGLEDCKM